MVREPSVGALTDRSRACLGREADKGVRMNVPDSRSSRRPVAGKR